MDSKNRNKLRAEFITLMRGFYSLPILVNLHKEGILKKLSLNNYTDIKNLKFKNQFFIEKVLKYLTRLDILQNKKTKFRYTNLGFKISKRIGTFYILNSYSKIPLNFSNNLKENQKFKNWCERKDNILGSGLIHYKKFFIPSLKISNFKIKKDILDIGCGDGTFLNLVKKSNPNIRVLGCDLSNKSVSQTKKNLRLKEKDFIFRVDGSDIELIKKKLDKKKIFLGKDSIISLWFLLHEISGNSKQILVKYLSKIRRSFPETSILIGEISSLSEKQMKKHNKISILPEFTLFHELSGQGLLSELDYFSIFKQSSYSVKKIIRTDKLQFNGISSSSNFICLIEPIKYG